MQSPLISPQQLNQLLGQANTIVLDASINFKIPNEQPKVHGAVIPTAVKFDYDKVFCDQESALPHMFPSEADFNTKAKELGLNNESIIVVYDNAGTYASPRAWWMLKAMGHKEVYVLDGGLPAWIEEGYMVNKVYRKEKELGNFEGKLDPDYFINADKVNQFSSLQSAHILDARSQQRFDSLVPEPREGLRSGHIPNSICLPFSEVMSGGKLKQPKDLTLVFDKLSLIDDKPMIFSCGSGVTACIILLAAYIIQRPNPMGIYDGSWTEWGANQSLPISVTE
ncbi:sulfurtransferase [Vibrio makurazakiensis]|uniref:sulfurtransferase n=1 Tax=Vibrio makurazakiensis TaxID=2910250 RepID=UPI003D13FAE6